MKITFPHMGNQYIATKVLLQELNLDIVIPPANSQKTLDVGTRYSPESMCLPLKLNIGNIVESAKKGANTVVFTGSCGPCRFGYYTILQREIVKEIGVDMDFVLLDPPKGDYNTLVKRIFSLTQTKNLYKIGRALQRGVQILHQIDRLDRIAHYKRPRQKNRGELDLYYDDFHRRVRKTWGYRETADLINQTKEKFLSIEEDPGRKVLRIGIVGEIYTIIEPFVNLYLERKLGDMGVEIEKSLETSRWLTEHLFLNPLGLSGERDTYKAAKPYLRTLIGGHARETIGYSVKYAKRGFDGIIQIYPLTCMPEIVAQAILPSVSRDYSLPYLCLIVDEMTGESGFTTRLEAFIDLITRRRERQEVEKLLSRC